MSPRSVLTVGWSTAHDHGRKYRHTILFYYTGHRVSTRIFTQFVKKNPQVLTTFKGKYQIPYNIQREWVFSFSSYFTSLKHRPTKKRTFKLYASLIFLQRRCTVMAVTVAETPITHIFFTNKETAKMITTECGVFKRGTWFGKLTIVHQHLRRKKKQQLCIQIQNAIFRINFMNSER